jgi:hypothetical protein
LPKDAQGCQLATLGILGLLQGFLGCFDPRLPRAPTHHPPHKPKARI